MNIAAIDIGSNAIRLVIARRILGLNQYEIIHKYRAGVRLGSDVFSNGKISKKNINKTIRVFKSFKKVLTQYNIQNINITAVATSALREATNRDDVIEQIGKKANVSIKVIDGLQEAQLIFNAVQNEINIIPHNVLLMDIGGGSVELTFALHGKPVATKSFPLGTVRLLEELKRKKLKEIDLPFLLIDSVPEIQNYIAANRSYDNPLVYLIGTGGNLEAMGKLKTQILRKQPGTSLTLSELDRIIERVRQVPIKQRTNKLKLREDRSDVIIPAMMITKLIMLQAGVQKLVIPYVGLKDGLVYSMINN